MMTYRECADYLLRHDNYRILTHRNPDGDTLASAGAFCQALRRAGKTAWLFPNTGLTRKLRPYLEQLAEPEGFVPECTVSVDIATEGLFAEGFEGTVDLAIDHHPTNSHFAPDELVLPEKSACGEIILELIQTLCGDVTPEEATLLYIAVTTDTGCFRYANTNSDTFTAASELLRFGAKAHMVSETFFRKVSVARLKLEGMIYSNMSFYRDGKIVVSLITRDMLEKSGAGKDDFDDLAGLSGRVEGCDINVTIREQENGQSKASIRSRPGVSSIAIAEVFGGGGHELAAGCTIAASPEQARDMLLAVINEQLS